MYLLFMLYVCTELINIFTLLLRDSVIVVVKLNIRMELLVKKNVLVYVCIAHNIVGIMLFMFVWVALKRAK